MPNWPLEPVYTATENDFLFSFVAIVEDTKLWQYCVCSTVQVSKSMCAVHGGGMNVSHTWCVTLEVASGSRSHIKTIQHQACSESRPTSNHPLRRGHVNRKHTQTWCIYMSACLLWLTSTNFSRVTHQWHASRGIDPASPPRRPARVPSATTPPPPNWPVPRAICQEAQRRLTYQ